MRKYVSLILFDVPHKPLTPSLFSYLKRLLSPQYWRPKRVQSYTVLLLKTLFFLCAERKVQSKSFNVHWALNNDTQDFPFLSGLWVCRSQAPSRVCSTNALMKFTTQQFLGRSQTPPSHSCSDVVWTAFRDFLHPSQWKDLNSHLCMHIFHHQLVSPCTLNLCQVISYLSSSPARHRWKKVHA